MWHLKIDLSLDELELVKQFLTERLQAASPEPVLATGTVNEHVQEAAESRNPVIDGVVNKIDRALGKFNPNSWH
jgi:hypothetical protein